MSLAQRVLLSYVFTLIFLIMVVLKLDGKVQWNWFLIFLPVWIVDAILILMLVIKMAGRCKPGYDPRNGSPDLRLRSWYLTATLLGLGFCLTLCAKLEKLAELKLSIVCIPLWAMMVGALLELGMNIFPERREV
ncbi:transmembrane protein 60-like [Gouania willdenowi]|uniref:Transmembrane protein 60-like n=1 Tax=Gouania willdenowi TaxID=441366 RepID=A0A8C5ND64_GOUWI|nr:transmembrane protein 60-like [Gouania willdenowi]XP_028305238.1 transmembrane protein 60-like [Gouania willdenowi]